MPRVLLTGLILFFGATTFVGCKSNCRQLSEKLCECATNTVDRDACLRQASNGEARYPPEAADEVVCESLLKTCDCHLIDTPEGKKACGLARQ